MAASNAQLQPKDGALAKWSIEFQASAVKGFECIRYELEGKKGKGHRYELHFTVEFKDMTACALIEEHITNIGDHKATLVISYTKAAEQTDLVNDDTPSLDEERRQATLKDND